MQIKSVILYSHDGRVRELPFELGAVNILSGPSGKGKSALLSVIDYCLGSSSFDVPAGFISSAVSWFAVKLAIGTEIMFVARRGVKTGKKASTEFYQVYLAGDETPTFGELRSNVKREEVVDRIGGRLGVGETLLPRADGTADKKKLTFRSGLIYCLQKQNEIANPDLYFHRQSELAQTIRDTLPYYLGAISPTIIENQARLRLMKKRLREIERELQKNSSVSERVDSEIQYLIADSVRLGLLDQIPSPGTSPIKLVDMLTEQFARTNFVVGEGSDVDTLTRLNTELVKRTRERADLKKQIDALEQFDGDQDVVDTALNEQRRRLQAIEVLPDWHDAATCPICESQLETVSASAADMRSALVKLGSELSVVGSDRVDLRRHLSTKRAELTDINEEISELRREVARLNEEQEEIRALLEKRNEISRLSGMFQMFRKLVVTADTNGNAALESARDALISDIELLEDETNLGDVRAKTTMFLGAIGNTLTEWAREQKLEYSAGFLTFDIRGPRLVSQLPDETVPFSRFGSGRNWVWYHLLGHMALHAWFRGNNRPVPSFIVLDQPSQVYFPSVAGARDKEDWQEVKRIYHWLFKVATDMEGGIQIIVTDHARFEDDKEFMRHLRHDWWNDETLVPIDWPNG
ncbi:DUF3732 domain-containing protein [Agrobacterium pusense]|uniref:DUF3732 domain-containing protein n=1 Tax=Agrobacterium pusense TaxID=648995 RepID=UPI00289B3915|nr:DUF3732 domain-containing protein [Agrobacterium pusense]